MSTRKDTNPKENTSDRHSDLLTVSEDYFPPLPPRSLPAPQLPTHLPARPPPLSHRASTASLAAKATTAISLPEGVYAQQQDGVSSGNASGNVTTAPSFSEGDAGSIRSIAPTVSTADGGEEGRENLEMMLSEILEEDREDGILAGLGTLRASALPRTTTEADDYSDLDLDSDSESVDSHSGDEEDAAPEEQRLHHFRSHRKHFFILSAAGKPVFSFHGNDSIVIPHLGAISAIISSFSTPSSSTTDNLQSFATPTTLFTVLSLPPLYLLATSTLPYETPYHLSAQLSLLHSQILSTITTPTLQSAFKNRFNFDLRRLIGGTEPILRSLCTHLPSSTSHLLSNALCILHLRASHRRIIHNMLIQYRAPSLLYGLILAPHKLVAVCRPKRHSLHPSDLQLLFNLLYNTPTFAEVGTEHWVPLCLPKFNDKGFLHVYVCFFTEGLACVLVSADKEAFYQLREMREKLVEGMKKAGLVSKGGHAGKDMIIKAGILEEKVKGYDNPVATWGVRHWVVKERGLVQITMPRCPGRMKKKRPKPEALSPGVDAGQITPDAGSSSTGSNAADNTDTEVDTSSRYTSIWRRLWTEVHTPPTSGVKGKIAFITIDSPSEALPESSSQAPQSISKQRQALLHVTQPYEIYAIGRKGVTRDQMIRAVREIVRWVKREEERVWVVGGATF
ncbi:DUF254-domain-containing protein [Ascodesmis nigricans]|uniref:Vacuolar fusion protein MON1 n=1 Tax=Ascodesmis nigricans TaxID=341454 RepID=A0A4S2N846_9PEZI|nr:DUF254-domain-containing protein [Ascodesmis nigricans]